MWHIFRISILLVVSLYVGTIMSEQESSNTQFMVYWNVPTKSCKSHKVNFDDILRKSGIIYNTGDEFKGEKITIFYNPGEFPIIKKSENKPDVIINGGIPQKGDVQKHLKALEETLKSAFPLVFEGIGVIDFEEWRPIFRQNWNEQEVYKNKSIDLIRSKNSGQSVDNKKILVDAQNEFEKAATEFMVKTLGEAKRVFPKASWGFYGFPYCYNHYSDDIKKCAKGVTDENNRIQEIFDKSDALFPSIYMNETTSRDKKQGLIIGRINEAERVWKKKNNNNKGFVFPYMWVRYLDSENYLNATDVEDSLEVTKKQNAGGVIIWGSSKDVNSEKKCQNLLKFVEEILGPAVKKVQL